MTVRFDDALKGYLEVTRAALVSELAQARKVILVRDLRGRLRLVVGNGFASAGAASALQKRLDEAAGPFSGGAPLAESDLLVPSALFESPDLREIDGCPGLWLLERTVMGADWTRTPLPNQSPTPPRATMFGIKGGVGRSTALCAWARHLAGLGKRVLVIDLDLESPGVSSTLLPDSAMADFGVVDWFVEDAVGNVDETLIRLMAAQSPLSGGTSGNIWVVPCGGSQGADAYMAKLARTYQDLAQPLGGVQTFADRLGKMLDALEAAHGPDVVLLDSRAGLHDLAAVTMARLDATVFLFAVGTRQTWNAYRLLLSQWTGTAVGVEVRERLKMVAAQIPEEGREDYLRRFELDSYDLLRDTMYEPSNLGEVGAFSFDVKDTQAPHYPLPVYWSRPLQDWNPLAQVVSAQQLDAALGDFLRGATDLVLNVAEDL